MVVRWLSLLAPNDGRTGSIPDEGIRFHMPHLRPSVVKKRKLKLKKKKVKKQRHSRYKTEHVQRLGTWNNQGRKNITTHFETAMFFHGSWFSRDQKHN